MQSSGFFIAYIIFFVVIMYFMIFLPQKKREKKAREMTNSLQVGSIVVTIGGVVGKVINIKDDELTVETSIERSQIVIKKWAVKEVVQPVEA